MFSIAYKECGSLTFLLLPLTVFHIINDLNKGGKQPANETEMATHVQEIINFNAIDEKGRVLGISVTRWEDPGKFWVYMQAARSGKTFGACQPIQVFSSLEERETAIRERVARTRKSAEKRFPPGVVSVTLS